MYRCLGHRNETCTVGTLNTESNLNFLAPSDANKGKHVIHAGTIYMKTKRLVSRYGGGGVGLNMQWRTGGRGVSEACRGVLAVYQIMFEIVLVLCISVCVSVLAIILHLVK